MGITVMSNDFFQFKKFTVFHNHCAMKVTTDACLFGAWVANKMSEKDWNGKNLLDIGTGTGLLSLMIAQQNNLHIDAVEIDFVAAEQASQNFSSSPFRESINIIHTDILGFKQEGYDCLVINTPFYKVKFL